MDLILSSIDYKDPVWLCIAFIFGALGRFIGLPPLVGFLVAGFVLNYSGAEGGEFLNEMADLGVTLLLFSIGLKLKVKQLFKIEIWGTALSNMILFIVISIAFLIILKYTGLPLFKELSLVNALIVSFALSFSSTVFVVKSLESKGDFLARYGQIAIGVLIIQDLVAVLFLGISEAKFPSLWAVVLIISIFVCRPFILKLMIKIGHDELLLLFGLVMALGGATLFELVDMKADLGALIFGVLLSNSVKANELSMALFGIKELFLVGFFLSIGMAGLPNFPILIAVFVLLILLTAKTGLFFILLTRFKTAVNTAAKTSISLGNFSEFGLIVMVVAVSSGWISTDWLVIISLLVSISFVISSSLNKNYEKIYSGFHHHLLKFQHPELKLIKNNIDLAGIQIIICGMGRIGSGAYEYLKSDKKIIGIDVNQEVVDFHLGKQRNVICATVSNSDFWNQINLQKSKVTWILLCLTNVEGNKIAAKLVRNTGFTGKISAVCHYFDEKPALLESGVDLVFNLYTEAGAGLAQHGQKVFQDNDA